MLDLPVLCVDAAKNDCPREEPTHVGSAGVVRGQAGDEFPCQPRFRDHPSPHLLICRIQVERENQRMLDLRRVNHSIALIQEGNELVEI